MSPTTAYRQNVKWLTWLAPFRVLSTSPAYLTPFFLQNGLSLSQILLLQSIFSAIYVALDVPSGWFADRKGRAFSIKLSAPIAAAATIAYGFSSHFWQFVVCEALLAIANSLFSGADSALLYDSLQAEGREEEEYDAAAQRIDGRGFAATAVGVFLAVPLVYQFGVSSAIIADGILTAIGIPFAMKLVEAPHAYSEADEEKQNLREAVWELARSSQVRWLVGLSCILSTSTYLAYWLSAPYYTSVGVPTAVFGAIMGVRSLWKAWLAHRFSKQRRLRRNMTVYAALAGSVYQAMATRQLWLIWVVLGHDVVQTLSKQPLARLMNGHMNHRHRASLNSVINLSQRLVYTVTGPLVGLVADRYGLGIGFVVLGLVSSCGAFIALRRLNSRGTFQ